jgi:acyl carrier protein
MDDIGAEIKRFILEDIAADLNIMQLDDDEPLIESGIMDSLGVLKIMAFLDESWGVDLSSEQVKLENFRDINAIRALVEGRKIQGNETSA